MFTRDTRQYPYPLPLPTPDANRSICGASDVSFAIYLEARSSIIAIKRQNQRERERVHRNCAIHDRSRSYKNKSSVVEKKRRKETFKIKILEIESPSLFIDVIDKYSQSDRCLM